MKKYSTYTVWYHVWFQASTGGVGTYPLQIRGSTVSSTEWTYSLAKNKIYSKMLVMEDRKEERKKNGKDGKRRKGEKES